MTASSSTLPYVLSKGFLQQIDHQIGMGIVGAEDQRLLARGRVEFRGQVFADDPVEWLGDDLAVEVLDIDLDFVGRGEQFDLVAARRRRP